MCNTYLAEKAPREPITNQFPQVLVYVEQITQVSLTVGTKAQHYIYIYIIVDDLVKGHLDPSPK